MNHEDQKEGSVRKRIGAAGFYMLNIVLFPITLLGYIIWIGKGVLSRNKSGVSATAQGPLSARWFDPNLGSS